MNCVLSLSWCKCQSVSNSFSVLLTAQFLMMAIGLITGHGWEICYVRKGCGNWDEIANIYSKSTICIGTSITKGNAYVYRSMNWRDVQGTHFVYTFVAYSSYGYRSKCFDMLQLCYHAHMCRRCHYIRKWHSQVIVDWSMSAKGIKRNVIHCSGEIIIVHTASSCRYLIFSLSGLLLLSSL